MGLEEKTAEQKSHDDGKKEDDTAALDADTLPSMSCSKVELVVKEYMHTVDVLNEVKPVLPNFAVLVGFEDQILPALLAEADGSICGLSNIVPELFVGLLPVHRGS